MNPRPAARPPTVWILDEGSTGHLVQSRGLVRELGKRAPLAVREIPMRWPFDKEWTRAAGRRFLKKWFLPPQATTALFFGTRIPWRTPGLIVSSGPHSLNLITALGRCRRCPTVLVQGTIKVKPGAVTAIVRPFEGETRDDYIHTPLLFTEITPEAIDGSRESARAALGLHPTQRTAAVFIGSSSKMIPFQDDDWDRLADVLNRMWRTTGLRYLLTTSYRTGQALEARLRSRIEPGSLAKAVWYASAPERVTRSFLAAADTVLATMDSLTMMTEAVSSGRPSWSFCPAGWQTLPRNPHTFYVDHLMTNGYLQALDPAASDLPPSAPVRLPDFTPVIDQLVRRLGWA